MSSWVDPPQRAPGSRRIPPRPDLVPCPLHFTPLGRDGVCPACTKFASPALDKTEPAT